MNSPDASHLLADIAAGRTTAAAEVRRALDRCHAQDDQLHCFITLDDTAPTAAAALDRNGVGRQALFGLPIAVKDTIDTAGLKTTYGSTRFRDHIPAHDDIIVQRAKAAGAIIVGKTNCPEFGFGAQCSNALCPSTRTPYDLSLSSGGSSGGSAAAVAAGFVPAAIGSDFGGSVRTPAAFCGVVGYRPSAGILPNVTRRLAWDAMPTTGFLTRSVRDAALLLEALAGSDPRDPTSRALPSRANTALQRIASSPDLGAAPMSSAMAAAFASACEDLRTAGHDMTAAHPDCTTALATFATLRAAHINGDLAKLRDMSEHLLSPTVLWNIARGDGQTTAAYLAAEADRSVLYRRFAAFFDRFDVLATPSASVFPFSADAGEVTHIDGKPLSSRIDYLGITSIITLTGCPALSLPYWPPGSIVPIGMQLVAAPGRDRDLLAFAARIELISRFGFRPPPLFIENHSLISW